MYKLRLWKGPGKDYFVKITHQCFDYMLVESLDDATECTIEFILENLGMIYETEDPERVEILQVREHAG
jgi:hypothetical protein